MPLFTNCRENVFCALGCITPNKRAKEAHGSLRRRRSETGYNLPLRRLLLLLVSRHFAAPPPQCPNVGDIDEAPPQLHEPFVL